MEKWGYIVQNRECMLNFERCTENDGHDVKTYHRAFLRDFYLVCDFGV